MPLLGKIEPGTITELVDSAVQAGQDAILRIEGPQHVGEIQLEAGQVVHASHQHTQLQETLNALCTVEEGEFMLCRGDEHNASSLTPSNVPVWLLDTNEERRTSLTQSLAQKGYSVGMLLHLEDMTALLQESKPSLLLLGEELATEHERALLTSLQQQQHMNVLLVGTPRDISPQLATATKGWLEWPGATEQMESIMRRWTSPHSPAPSPPQSAQTALQLLSHLTPTMDPRQQLRLNPNPPRQLKEHPLPQGWQQWLFSSPHQRSVQGWLQDFPGPNRMGHFVLRSLKQSGILQTANIPLPDSATAETLGHNVSIEEVSALASSDISQDAFVLLKVIVFGLRGKRRDEWISSLQQISQTQSSRIPRDRSVQIPHIPKAELARIPLRSDSLLVVYGALTENAVDSLLEKIGTNLASFLFFIDFDNHEELIYIRELRKKLLSRYALPDLVMVSGSEGKDPALISQQLELQGESLWHPIDTFNIRTSYKLLRILLLRTASSKRKKKS
ncbi:MAG TPA: hypothetical protein DCE42_13985 [Myxococcales bacterium]|nr:hypothetical protein [Deltaproteobacteria bacterium]HAA55868.1 hypothetical protein [Myxococcales bacterium]|tara:strand:+ start:6422 stop:7933 length:1512 start_codon:yes stop_codon:yes gene_type:complete